MAGFLPKDYVGVSTRIEQAHTKYEDGLSIETNFEIKDQTVIFSAKVTIKGLEAGESSQVFTGHSFGTVGREKSFEKLETVAVGRALAFAGFETTSGIASREEMEVFDDNEKNGGYQKKEYADEPQKPWMNKPELDNLKENLQLFADADDAVKKARTKYAVSKAMEQSIRDLF